MEVKKINKLKNIVVEKLGEILNKIKLGLLVLPGVAMAYMLLGCAPTVTHATPTDSPEVIQTLKPVNTPKPTPIPTMVATPVAELTLEQKQLVVGANKNLSGLTVSEIAVYNIELNGNNFRIWARGTRTNDPAKAGVVEIYDVFTETHLFTVKLPVNQKNLYYMDYVDYITNVNPALKSAKFKDSNDLATLARRYKSLEIDYKNNAILNEFSQAFSSQSTDEETQTVLDTVLSKEQMLDLYINSTLDKELFPYWIVVPGSRIPEELKGIYSEIKYPPATFPSPTVQQSNRVDPNVEDGPKTLGYYKTPNHGRSI